MTDAVENGYQIYKPTIGERFWRALGFRLSHCPGFDDVGTQGDPRWAPGEVSTHVVIRLGTLDRLRVLVSGTLDVQQRMRTNVLVDDAETRTVTTVVWPGFYPARKP